MRDVSARDPSGGIRGLGQRGQNHFARRGFSQIFVRAQVVAELFILVGEISGCVKDKRYRLPVLVLAHLIAEPVTIHPRHENVRYDRVHFLTHQDLRYLRGRSAPR